MADVVKFSDFMKKRFKGEGNLDNPISKVLHQDLREQKELLAWYSYHSSFNKHKLFLHSLSRENHQEGQINPNAGFVVAYTEEQASLHAKRIQEAATWDNRKHFFLDARGGSLRTMAETISGEVPSGQREAFKVIEKTLLETPSVVIICEISKSKIQRQAVWARAFMKVLDDAHLQGIQPEADLVFIDHAAFLQRHWKTLGSYITIMS